MKAERPEKATIRKLWYECIQKYDDENDLIFFTLSGAEGLDVKYLIKTGYLETTETGALAANSAGKVVALESSAQAVLRLQSEIPGLKVLRASVQEVLHGNSSVRFPNGDQEQACRARVVNLDLNCPLAGEIQEGEVEFPVLQWVKKFAQIHAAVPRKPWTLLLTLHGEVEWPPEVCKFVKSIFQDNFGANEAFRDGAKGLLGQELFDAIEAGNVDCLDNLSVQDQQRVLLLLVPKRVIQVAGDQHWRVETCRALRYGGQGGHAPMVTWIIDFSWEQALAAAPNQLYQINVNDVVANIGMIGSEGEIEEGA